MVFEFDFELGDFMSSDKDENVESFNEAAKRASEAVDELLSEPGHYGISPHQGTLESRVKPALDKIQMAQSPEKKAEIAREEVINELDGRFGIEADLYGDKRATDEAVRMVNKEILAPLKGAIKNTQE